MSIEILNNNGQPSFKESLLADATASQPAEQETKKPRGRPKKVVENPIPLVKPVPICNEVEAALFASAIVAITNSVIKKEYRDAISISHEEALNISRPLVVLKDYYLPNAGGIYAIWMQLFIAGGSIGFAKYKIMKELMENDTKQNGKPNGEEGNTNIGNEGDGKVDESKGIAREITEGISL